MKRFVTQDIAEYISEKKIEDFPPEVIDKAKYCILDSIGCMLAGITTKEGEILLTSLLNREIGFSSILGFPKCTNLLNAVYINSTTVNILDFDDNYIGHPGATIIPTALNISELFEVTGKELITAIIIAYEVSIRIGMCLRSEEERKYTLGHGTWQVFGSASVASKLLQLKKEEIQNAFGIAGANAPVPSVMKTTYGLEGPSMAKNNFGMASIAGLQSGLLAKNGFTGPKDIFDGETAFWKMIGKKQNRLDNNLLNDIDRDFRILRVSFKLYPCCRLMHSTIDETVNYIKKNNIELDSVEKIIIKTIDPLSKFPFTITNPKDATEGRFSVPFVLACALHGINNLKWYEQKNINNGKLQKIAKKIKIENDNQANNIFQEDPRKVLSRITIIQKNKKKFYCEGLVPRGNNLTFTEKGYLKDKFFQLASTIFTNSKKINALIEIIMELEKIKNIAGLVKEFSPIQ